MIDHFWVTSIIYRPYLGLNHNTFTAYVSPVGDLIESFGVSYHQFADNTQLLVAMKVHDATPALKRLANCSAAVRSWFLWNDLQLDADKSEAVVLGTAPQLRSAATVQAVEVAGSRHTQAEVAWCNNRFAPAVRLPCQRRSKGLQLPHTRPASRVQSAV